jgi:hypothetical protein
MIRKLLSIVAASALVLGASMASAGNFDPPNSTISVQIGSIPSTVRIPATGGTVTLSDDGFGGHIVADTAGVWATTDFSAGTAFYTGIPLISNVKITVENKSGSMADGWGPVANPFDGGSTCDPNDAGGTCLGGYEPLIGVAVIHALGLQIPIDLGRVGWHGTDSNTGNTATGKVLNNNITLTAMSFVTGTVRMTGISTNLVTHPTKGSGAIFTMNLNASTHGLAQNIVVAGVIVELQTVTVNGTNSLMSGASTKDGMITLISPIRVNTGGLVGRIPALVKKKFVFVPEPGTMLLLVSGAVGLAVVGRKRMRK